MVPTDSPVQIVWDEKGSPRSLLFDDKYFCQDNGYEESLYVCCEGNRLPERFARLDPSCKGVFTIVETGFGTGLDFCSTWRLWDSCAPSSWMLNFVSLELYPLSLVELNRALSLWPALVEYKDALIKHYRPLPGEVVTWTLVTDRVQLTIAFEDVVAALDRIEVLGLVPPSGADALFLDGFAPSKNPAMWSTDVFQRLSALSGHTTTLSTFTVAGWIRRGLEAEGFTLRKIPGLGKKLQILTGCFKGQDLHGKAGNK